MTGQGEYETTFDLRGTKKGSLSFKNKLINIY